MATRADKPVGTVFFYHLTRRRVEDALPQLLEASLGRGWRVAIRGRDAGFLEWLDQKLWQGPEDRFLPHGLAGGPHDVDQPVLLTTGEAANRPSCVMSIGGADVDPAEVSAMERVCVLFDGQDETALEHARGQWKTLTEAGCAAQYWSEENGRWEMKAERGA